MHIGFLAPDLNHDNGWSHYSLSLVQALRAQDARLTLITARNSPQQPDLQQFLLLPTVTPPDRFSLARMARSLPRVRQLLQTCDVIHCTTETYAPLAALIAGDRPLFITAHGTYVNLPRMRRFPINRLYRWAFLQSHLVCVSNYTASVAQRIMPAIRTTVVNNSIDPARFESLPALSDRPDRPVVLTTGGVKPRKGTLQLVRAIARVRETVPDVLCLIVGSTQQHPAYVAQVRQEIDTLNLSDHVRLTGFMSETELLAWYGAADVFVMPSINDDLNFEGFGLVFLEASAAGLPVIGTTDCGAEDAIQPDVTGLLVEQSRVETDLPVAITALLTDPDRARRLGETGRRFARQQTWDRVAAQMMSLYHTGTLPESETTS